MSERRDPMAAPTRRQRDRFPTVCERCAVDLATHPHTMSRFNTDTICLACKVEEAGAPGFAAAKQAEEDAVRAGEYNFPGVGLSAADEVYLRERRALRKVVTP